MGKLERLLHKDREEIIDFCRKHNSIYIYGAGKVAKKMVLYLEEEEIHIEGIIVGNGHKKEIMYCGYHVLEIDEWEYKTSDGIILGVSEDKQQQVFQNLLYAGVNKRNIYFQKIFECPILPWNYTAVSIDENKEGKFFASRNELNELGIYYKTDKSDQYHNYLRKYEFFLKPYRYYELNVLELGVFNGGSLKMWEKYFERAYIYGVDINIECKKYENERRKIIICDLAKKESYNALKRLRPMIIVDDASHMWSHQIKALYYLFPSLASGGIYIIEDLGTNFSERYVCNYNDASISCFDFLQEIAKIVTSGEFPNLSDMKSRCIPFMDEIFCLAKQVEMITFIRESCIIIKR